MKKPHLVVEIENPSDVHQGKYKILNLKVKNKRSAGILKFSNQTATQVRVYLTFKDFASKTDLFTTIARWNTTREPLTPDYKTVDVGLALTNQREVISPDEEPSLSVAIKKSGEIECYAFNNESYLQQADFANPKWKISDDKVIVIAKVQTAEVENIEASFLLINKAVLNQFSISKYKE